MRLLFDVNVIIDLLADRQPFADSTAAVMALVESGSATGLVAAHTVTTVFYLLNRHPGHDRAKQATMDLLRLLHVVPVDHDRLLQALAMNWNDFEDAVQAACAAKAKADYLLTRNKQDFRGAEVAVLSPAEFLALAHG